MNTEEIRQAAQQYLIMLNAYSADKKPLFKMVLMDKGKEKKT